MRPFRKKSVRICWMGSSRGSVDRVINHLDVLEVSESEAREWIAAGLAEETEAPLGSALAPNPGKNCWRCGGGPQNFYVAVCQYCAAQL